MNNQVFSIREAVKAGWEKTKSNVGSFAIILLACAILSIIVDSLVGDSKDPSTASGLIRLVGWVVTTFIGMGIVRVVFKVLDGGKAALSDFTSNPEHFGKYLLGALIYTVIVSIGFVLLIIPGIFLHLRLQFMPFLIVEKQLGPVEALQRSWDITKGQTWNLFLFLLVSILVVLLGAVALLVGLFWAIPTIMIAMAFVYRKLDRASVAAV